jgi:hypothetical protein
MHALYLFSQWLQTHSILLTEAIRQSLIVGMVFGVLQWNESQLGVVLSAVSAVLAIFTSKNNVASSRVELIKEKAMDQGIRMGTGTGDGRLPPAA